jgi:outer membrane receptor for ferrienterochelin and colicin
MYASTVLGTPAPSFATNIVPTDYDKQFALFAENTWQATDKLAVILGIRADNDNLLENKTAFIPRVAGIYKIDNSNTLKYMYNSGYVRPSVIAGNLGQNSEKLWVDTAHPLGLLYNELPADKSETIQTHDIEYMFKNDKTQATATVYQTEMDNFFNYNGNFATSDGSITGTPNLLSPNGLPYRLTTVNSNPVTTHGVELDVKRKVNDSLNIYGNLSCMIDMKVDSLDWTVSGYKTSLKGGSLYTNDREVCEFPEQSWNLGADVKVKKDVTVNVNDRGWTGMWTFANNPLTAPNTSTDSVYEKLGMQNFVDATVTFDNLCGKSMSLSIFVKNLLNNDQSKIGLTNSGGYWTDEGISGGAKISYKFM